MSVRFLHTADWQLGKPFAPVEDASKRALLQQERIAVIGRIGAVARQHEAEFVIVAGDLFDSPSATKATVAAACAAIGQIALPVFAIPGNHDHGGPGSLWEQSFFRHESQHLAPNLRVLLAPEPVELASAVLLPCPMARRHEGADTTAWLRTADLQRFSDKPRIVIAHGSVQGFVEEDATLNQLDLARLNEAEVDYIALGDWHGAKQVAPKAWYSGTPELDRFAKGAANEPGHVLLVAAARGTTPQVESLGTARLSWHRIAFEFADDPDLARLENEIDTRIAQRAQCDLLHLTLSGTLGIEAMARLKEKLDAWEARLLRLVLVNGVRITPTAAEAAALTHRASDPLISQVATKLLEGSQGGDSEEAACALLALQELHAACSGR